MSAPSKALATVEILREALILDGYPMEDVIMRWLGGGGNKRESVHGVDNVEIPQFSIADYKISSTIEELQTGA